MRERNEPGTSSPTEVTVTRWHRLKASERKHFISEETGQSSSTSGKSLASRVTPSSSASHGHSSTSNADGAIAEAMAIDEATRAHGFSRAIGIAAISVSVIVMFLGGDPLAKYMCIAAMFVMGLVSFWIWYISRNPNRYTQRIHRIYGYVLLSGVIFVMYYFGFFSPIAAVVTLGIYFFGQSKDRVYGYLFPVFTISSIVLLASLTAFSVIKDRGLFPADDVGLPHRLFAIVGIALVLCFTLWLARVARSSMYQAIRQSNEMLLVAQQRGALLAEAQNQLDHALRLAIGKPGRYTGSMAGPYQLGTIIGVGAMGEVYEAENIETRKPAAVKLLQADAMDDQKLFERFVRESDIGRQLVHPNLVEVYEVGKLADDSPFISMERLEGEDLGAVLRKDDHLSLKEVVALAEDMAEGLQYAHEAGVIHRDLKPYNIFRARDENGKTSWKILDFGVSKLRDSGKTLTREGAVGTPRYMSPEQAKNTNVDSRSDIFAMAAVIYRVLTGRPAFSGQSTPQIMFDIVYRNPERPSTATRGIPREVDQVLAIGLAKDRTKRFTTALEFATALKAASKRKLSPELRELADKIIEQHPWGQLNVNEKGKAEELVQNS
ncbi:MAG: protein kinase [Deltaproteobacteria bacterium]|nr:protein kinase [Deltaproteobacteria bacterium]